MPEKSVTISVRLSTNDAAFLADYNAEGATTLSEKIRSVIREARQNEAGNRDFESSLGRAEYRLKPSFQRLRALEEAYGMHSELIAALAHWLPETMAHLMADPPEPNEENAADRLEKLEAVTADRIFALFEQVLRLGVTGESPCYDPSVIVDRTSTVVRLCEIIKDTSNQK